MAPEIFSPVWCSGKHLVARMQSTNSHCDVRKWQVSERKASVELLVHISVISESKSISSGSISASSAFPFTKRSNFTLPRCFHDSIVYPGSQYSISFWNPFPPTIHVGFKSCIVNPMIKLSRIFVRSALHFHIANTDSIFFCPEEPIHSGTCMVPWVLCRWSCKFVALPWYANFCLQTLQVTLLLSTLSK